jgi:hypothetical protein
MSAIEIKTLVGTALIDREFCEALLDRNRRPSLAEYDLTDEEREAILQIKADSVQEFALRLHEWLIA